MIQTADSKNSDSRFLWWSVPDAGSLASGTDDVNARDRLPTGPALLGEQSPLPTPEIAELLDLL